VALLLALLLPAIAAANTLCDRRTGNYCCYQYRAAPPDGSSPQYHFVFYTAWDSFSPYYGQRKRPDGTLAWNVLYSAGFHDFANSVNVWRQSRIKNSNGAANTTYDVQHWTSASCS
jgi:hypothetical protein